MKFSTSIRFGMALGLALVAAMACGDDDSPGGGASDAGAGGDGAGGDGAGGDGAGGDGAGGDGAGGDGAGGDGGSAGAPSAGGEGGDPGAAGMGQGGALVNPCDPAAPLPVGEDCPEFVECAETECQGAYQTCFGDDYQNGDFTGGVCEDYMTCVTDCGSAEDCDTDCAAACESSAACDSCFANTIGNCIVTNCRGVLLECAFGGGGAGGGGNAGGGCAELEACCNSLSGEDQTECNMALDASMSIDFACGFVLAGYQADEQC